MKLSAGGKVIAITMGFIDPSSSRSVRYLDKVLSGLRPALLRQRYVVPSIVAAACRKRGGSTLSEMTRSNIEGTFAANHAKIIWSETSADEALSREIGRQLREGNLPHSILLVSRDDDFVTAVTLLKGAGHRVIIYWGKQGGRLCELSDGVVNLQHLIT